MITSTDHQGRTMALLQADGTPAARGQTYTDHRGHAHTLTGGRAPHHAASTGRIWTGEGREYFPQVLGLHWGPTC